MWMAIMRSKMAARALGLVLGVSIAAIVDGVAHSAEARTMELGSSEPTGICAGIRPDPGMIVVSREMGITLLDQLEAHEALIARVSSEIEYQRPDMNDLEARKAESCVRWFARLHDLLAITYDDSLAEDARVAADEEKRQEARAAYREEVNVVYRAMTGQSQSK